MKRKEDASFEGMIYIRCVKKGTPVKNLLISASLFMTSCSFLNWERSIESSFASNTVVQTVPKSEYTQVELFGRQPSRAAIQIGTIRSFGNRFSHFNELSVDARKQAAALGGDFIVQEEAGVKEKSVWIPASTTYTSQASNKEGGFGKHADREVVAETQGAKMRTDSLPWGVFSVWVYLPSQTGIRSGKDHTVTGFLLSSDAQSAGVKTGDQLLGIDGIDIDDDRLSRHLMEVFPGEKMKLTLLRDAVQIQCSITALQND